MDDEIDIDTQWTDDARTRLREAADALVAAVEDEVARLIAMTEGTFTVPVDYVVDAAAAAYADARFDLTGMAFSLRQIMVDEEDDDDDEPEREELPVASIVSVLQRTEFGVTDADAVIAAGKAAWLEHIDGADAASAERHVPHLGAAMYTYAHVHGWDSLTELAGLEPWGSITQVIEPAEELDPRNENLDLEHPSPAFGIGGTVLFGSSDVWRY